MSRVRKIGAAVAFTLGAGAMLGGTGFGGLAAESAAEGPCVLGCYCAFQGNPDHEFCSTVWNPGNPCTSVGDGCD
jgi:hypothetical protein